MANAFAERGSGFVVLFRVRRSVIDSVIEQYGSACEYWADDSRVPSDREIAEGVRALLARGGKRAAQLVKHWNPDLNTVDVIVQLGVFGDIRYG